ncbi:hypothetical protein LEMLEM_LOCUS3397, partial [Lemmus lemmus]
MLRVPLISKWRLLLTLDTVLRDDLSCKHRYNLEFQGRRVLTWNGEQVDPVMAMQKCIFHGQTSKAPIKGDFSTHCAVNLRQEEYHRQSDGSFWKRIGHLQTPAAH